MGQQPGQWSRFGPPVASSILMNIATQIEDTIAAFAKTRHRQAIPIQILADNLPGRCLTSTGRQWEPWPRASSRQRASWRQASTRLVLVEKGLFPLTRTLAQVGVLGYQEWKESGPSRNRPFSESRTLRPAT